MTESTTSKWQVDESRVWFREESGWPVGLVPYNLDFTPQSVADWFDARTDTFADSPYMWFLDTTYTYRQLRQYVDAFGTALQKLGIGKNDVVAIMLPNSIQYVIAFYATLKIGGVATGINPTYKPLEVLHQLQETKAKILVCLDALYPSCIAPILDQSELTHIIATNLVDLAYGIPLFKRLLGKWLKKIPAAPVPGSIKFMKLLETTPAIKKVEVDPEEDAAVYMMTGGTTGVPKAAVLTHLNILSNLKQTRAWLFEQRPKSAMIGVIPFFHSFAMTTVMGYALEAGIWTLTFPKPPDQGDLVDRINQLATPDGFIYPGAEILFIKLADYLEKHPEKQIRGKITMAVAGAGPLHKPVKDRFEAISQTKLVEGYGLAEATPVVSGGPMNNKDIPGTIGLPFPGVDWAIFDREDFSRGPMPEMGEQWVGEICVSGPNVMKGYLNRPEETDDIIREWDGRKWLLTGDIGFMMPNGMIRILDRKKQMIKVKGYSVFPKEVEELIGNHPDVSEVAVAGLPDVGTGEAIKAWIIKKPGSNLTEEALFAWCKENITHYKVPKYLEFREDLPKTAVGKILRRHLQEQDPLFKK
jgi:long-chain acyl-CoA synthetase